jgi:hypothetical protein
MNKKGQVTTCPYGMVLAVFHNIISCNHVVAQDGETFNHIAELADVACPLLLLELGKSIIGESQQWFAV